jgi:hypothetical protein
MSQLTMVVNHTRQMIARGSDHTLIDVIPSLGHLFTVNPDWHHTDRIEILLNPTYDDLRSLSVMLGYRFSPSAYEYYSMINPTANNNGKGS